MSVKGGRFVLRSTSPMHCRPNDPVLILALTPPPLTAHPAPWGWSVFLRANTGLRVRLNEPFCDD